MSDLAVRSRWLAHASLMVLVVVSLLFALQVVSAIRMLALDSYFIITLIPMPFYLYAIGSVWRALLAIGKGNKFAPLLGKLLRRVGISLFVGGISEVFFVAWLESLVGGNPAPFSYNVTAITIGVIGAGLYIISGLIDEAIDMKRELDEFI